MEMDFMWLYIISICLSLFLLMIFSVATIIFSNPEGNVRLSNFFYKLAWAAVIAILIENSIFVLVNTYLNLFVN